MVYIRTINTICLFYVYSLLCQNVSTNIVFKNGDEDGCATLTKWGENADGLAEGNYSKKGKLYHSETCTVYSFGATFLLKPM